MILSENMHYQLLEKAYPLLVALDLYWRVKYVSEGLEQRVGEIVGKHLFSIFERKQSLVSSCSEKIDDEALQAEFFMVARNTVFAIRGKLIVSETTAEDDTFILLATPWLDWYKSNGSSVNFDSLHFSLLDMQLESQVSTMAKESMLREMEQLAASLSEQKKAAELANEAKTRFVKHVSHEIRTPLNGIITSVELLQDEDEKSRTKKLLHMIDHSARSLSRLVGDILDFSKLEQGVFPSQLQVFQVRDMVAELLTRHQSDADNRHITLTDTIDPEVPLWINANREALEKVLDNLIDNAIRHSGSSVVSLDISASPGEQRLCQMSFAVCDRGIGIPAEDIDSIFEPFWTSTPGISESHAMGLGLPIVRNLATSLGGTVSVDSEPGQGSTFRMDCPAELAAAPKSSGGSVAVGRQPQVAFQGEVLLVDDNQINLELARILLTKLGLSVSTAANGEQAVDYEKRVEFDLIVMDIAMPVMDGTEATRRIRNNGRNRGVPIIAFTANVSAGDVDSYLDAGFNDMLAKPARQEAIIKFCDQFLDRVC